MMKNINSGEQSSAKSVGYNGCLLIDDTNEHTGKFFAFVPQATTVINKTYQTSIETSTSHEEKTDLSSATVYAGAYISAGKGDSTEYYFDSIQLTSGSVVAYYL